LDVDGRSLLMYSRVATDGHTLIQHDLGPGDSTTQPTMAAAGNTRLLAWAGDSSQTIMAAVMRGTAGVPHPIPLVPGGGSAEHPYAIAGPHGFFVVFDWQRPHHSNFDLELASLGAGARPRLVTLLRTRDYALYPRGVVDGSGALDLLYLQRTSPGMWHVFFRRFSPGGATLGQPVSVGTISYTLATANGCVSPDIVPSQWAIDLKRAADGSVWAAWEDGQDCVSTSGVSGSNTLYLGHWDRNGRVLLPPVTAEPGVDAGSQVVALAVQGAAGRLYYPQPMSNGSILVQVAFDRAGRVSIPDRVAYDGGGNVFDPRAGTLAGRPRVIWQKVRLNGATLEGTAYRPAQPPDLLTHLGLNVGNLWGNLLLIAVGALGGSLALTAVNIFLLLPLVLFWFLLRRIVNGRIRWPLYLAGVAILLGWIFGLHSSPPSYVLAVSGLSGIPTLGSFYRWIAVIGGVFVAAWSNRYLLDRQESSLRAAATALAGLYFIFAMDLVLFIQGQITQI
ncbi:MAG TPA: hypothetical protein VF221_04725, partial [Chloroflexota bacterium]